MYPNPFGASKPPVLLALQWHGQDYGLHSQSSLNSADLQLTLRCTEGASFRTPTGDRRAGGRSAQDMDTESRHQDCGNVLRALQADLARSRPAVRALNGTG
jgi:hypothetical protein